MEPRRSRDESAATEAFRRTLARERFDRLAAEADAHLDGLRTPGTPEGVTLERALARRGISRREFLKRSTILAAIMGLPPMFAPRVARAHALAPGLPVIWQELQSCSGNSMASLRSADPDPSELFLALVSLEYAELLMAPAGQAAEDVLDAAIARHDGRYLAVFEGSVPVGDDGRFLTLGAAGETGARRVERIAAHAAAVIDVGTCASYGGIPAARPNPTTARGVGRFLEDRGVPARVVNLPGCPVSSTNLVGTLLEYTMFGRLPSLDAYGRPRWAYQHRIHDTCERRGHFEAGEFVEGWSDVEGLEKGLCLFEVGCKGPKAYNDCPVVRFNDATSWPVMAGHGCIGCSEPDFWDVLSPFEEPLPGPRRRGRGRG